MPGPATDQPAISADFCPSTQWRRYIIPVLALLLAASVAIWRVDSWPQRVRFAGELDTVEGRALADAVQLRQGVHIYAAPTPTHFNAAIYGPLYYLVASRLVDPAVPGYRNLRLLSALASLALGLECALLAYWLTQDYLAAFTALFLWLSQIIVTEFGTFSRADSMALFLWFSGFLIAYRFRHDRRVLLAAPLMTLGFFYKQQYIAGPLAVIAFLLWERRFRVAAEFAALLAALGLAGALLFQFVIFRGDQFLLHLVTFNLLPFDRTQGMAKIAVAALLFLPLCAVSCLYLHLRKNRLLLAYLAFAVAVCFAMLPKQGSAVNYGFEISLVSCVLGAALVCDRRISMKYAFWILPVVTAALAMNTLVVKLGSAPRLRAGSQDTVLQTYLRSHFPPGSAALSYWSGDVIRAGLSTPITDLYQYRWLICAGKIPPNQLLDQIRNREFKVIIRSSDDEPDPAHLCLSREFKASIEANYRQVATFDASPEVDFVWVPR